MSDRYTQATENSAANDFFDSGDKASDNDETETMSQTESPTATVSTGEERTIVANETSDYYISVGHIKALASAFVKAHPDLSLNWSGKSDSELHPQVRYVKALHSLKGDIGARQRDAEGNVAIGFGSEDWYAGTFGAELPTIETEPVDGGILSTLEAQEGVAKDEDGEPTWPEGSTDELGQGLPVLLPVVEGEVLPPYVQSDDKADAAIELVNEIPREPDVAPAPEQEGEQESDEAEVESDGSADSFFGNEEESTEPVDLPEGVPNPETMSVNNIRDFVTELTSVEDAEAMLAAEVKGDNRKTAITALEGRRNRLQDSDDVAGTEAEGESEPEPEPAATTSESTPEAKAELANALIADGMPAAEALEQVRNL